jgi:Flp pilus assembly pilin Flp
MNYHAVYRCVGRRIISLVASLEDESGSNAIEYGLMVAVLALIIFGGMSTVSAEVGALFDTINNDL